MEYGSGVMKENALGRFGRIAEQNATAVEFAMQETIDWKHHKFFLLLFLDLCVVWYFLLAWYSFLHRPYCIQTCKNITQVKICTIGVDEETPPII